MTNLQKVQSDLFEKKAREMVDKIYAEIFFLGWDKAKALAVLSLESSREWAKSVRSYYTETKAITDTIDRMITVVGTLKPLDYGDKKRPTTREELRAARGCGND